MSKTKQQLNKEKEQKLKTTLEEAEYFSKNDVFIQMGLTKDPIANQLNKLFENIIK